jgi:Zn-dependent protease with chaperone function
VDRAAPNAIARMKQIALALVFLLGIPMAGIVGGALLLQRPGLQAVHGLRQSSSGSIQIVSVAASKACGDVQLRERVKTLCHERDALVIVIVASAICAGGSLALLAAIMAAARIARGSRRRLVVLFGTGRRLVLAMLCIVVIAQGLIAIVIIGALSTAMFGFVPGAVMFPVFIGTLVGAVVTIRFSLARNRRQLGSEVALEVARSEQPRLWALIQDIATRLGTRAPDHAILTIQPSFYATGVDLTVVGSTNRLRGETLCLSLPLMRMMTPLELIAVIGHELGHFRGDDIAYSLRFAPVYTHMVTMLHITGQLKGIATLPLKPAQAILGFFLQQFAYAERAIGRQRESEADRAGVAVAGAPALASALLKAATLVPLWQFELRELDALVRQNRLLTNASTRFEDLAKTQLAGLPIDQIIAIGAAHRMPHPTDTHPPTAERLLMIGVQLEAAAKDVTVPADAAIALLDAPEVMERRLSAAQAQLMMLARQARIQRRA